MSDPFNRKNIEGDVSETIYQYYRDIAIEKIKKVYEKCGDKPVLSEIKFYYTVGIDVKDYLNVIDRIFTLFDYKSCYVESYSEISKPVYKKSDFIDEFYNSFRFYIWISKPSPAIEELIKTRDA